MNTRRIVTGHAPDGRSIVVSDEEVPGIVLGPMGSSATLLWGRDDPGRFPDDGAAQQMGSSFPPPGGCAIAVISLAAHSDEFHRFVQTALAPHADPDDAGMHRTATLDYDLVLEGTIGLELDDGVEVLLGPGDLVVQNGTRHRWHNRGDTVARYLSVTVGATNDVDGGRPVTPS